MRSSDGHKLTFEYWIQYEITNLWSLLYSTSFWNFDVWSNWLWTTSCWYIQNELAGLRYHPSGNKSTFLCKLVTFWVTCHRIVTQNAPNLHKNSVLFPLGASAQLMPIEPQRIELISDFINHLEINILFLNVKFVAAMKRRTANWRYIVERPRPFAIDAIGSIKPRDALIWNIRAE